MSRSTANPAGTPTGRETLTYASSLEGKGPPSLREGITVVIRLTGLLMLVWGAWNAADRMLQVLLGSVLNGNIIFSLTYAGFWQNLLLHPVLTADDELVIGILLIRFSSTFAGWTLPRR